MLAATHQGKAQFKLPRTFHVLRCAAIECEDIIQSTGVGLEHKGRVTFSSNIHANKSCRIGDDLNVDRNCSVRGGLEAASFNTTSDPRLKSHVIPLSAKLAMKVLSNIEIYEYEKSGLHDVGVLSSEVKKVFPRAVGVRADGYETVCYDMLFTCALKVIKTLESRVSKLEERLAD